MSRQKAIVINDSYTGMSEMGDDRIKGPHLALMRRCELQMRCAETRSRGAAAFAASELSAWGYLEYFDTRRTRNGALCSWTLTDKGLEFMERRSRK